MLKLNPDCHNYKLYEEQGRCPLVHVCDENCIFVWKALYDEKINSSNSEVESLNDEVDDLKYEVDDLEYELESLNDEVDDLKYELNCLEDKYCRIIRELAKNLDEEQIKKLDKSEKINEVSSSWVADILKYKEQNNV